MTLPTCFYCPECGNVFRLHTAIHLIPARSIREPMSPTNCPGIPIKVPIIPPGTPLPVILDTLGIPYREGWGLFYDQPETEWSASPHQHENDVPVLVVDNPATDEAHDG